MQGVTRPAMPLPPARFHWRVFVFLSVILRIGANRQTEGFRCSRFASTMGPVVPVASISQVARGRCASYGGGTGCPRRPQGDQSARSPSRPCWCCALGEEIHGSLEVTGRTSRTKLRACSYWSAILGMLALRLFRIDYGCVVGRRQSLLRHSRGLVMLLRAFLCPVSIGSGRTPAAPISR
jgi:hypothetical protein